METWHTDRRYLKWSPHIGKLYGGLTILDILEVQGDRGVTMVSCRCLSCGKNASFRATNVVAGAYKSCGCLRSLNVADYIGKIYNKLKVLQSANGVKGRRGIMVKCACHCGSTVVVKLSSLINGNTKSCGCLRKLDYSKYIGNVYGRLRIIKCVNNADDYYRATVECECECGNICIKRLRTIKAGDTKSCGCLVYTKNGVASKESIRGYSAWNSMMRRCYQSGHFITDIPGLKFLERGVRHPGYKDYGSRGITVCEDWYDPEVFVPWYMKNIKDDETMDRIDNDKGYYPNNIRSANKFTQSINRRKTKSNKSGYIGVGPSHGKWWWHVSYKSVRGYGCAQPSILTAVMNRNLYIIENGWPNALSAIIEDVEMAVHIDDPKDLKTWRLVLTDSNGITHYSDARTISKNPDKDVMCKLINSLNRVDRAHNPGEY